MSTAAEQPSATALQPRIASALLRYRVLAYTTGVLLIGLTIAFIGKLAVGYSEPSGWSTMTGYIGIAHGWIYVVYLALSLDLAVKARFRPLSALLVLLAGTIPLMSFVAEHFVTKRVRAGVRL